MVRNYMAATNQSIAAATSPSAGALGAVPVSSSPVQLLSTGDQGIIIFLLLFVMIKSDERKGSILCCADMMMTIKTETVWYHTT